MIIDTLENASKYFCANPLFQRPLNISGLPILKRLKMGNMKLMETI